MSPKNNALTVSELNEYVKMLLENNAALKDIWVCGELSGVKVYSSGHMYFSLKDSGSVVSCVMFRTSLAGLDFTPEDGMQVLLHGRLSSYVPRGQYQLITDRIIPDGAGSLAIAFEQLKRKLEAEGLFDPARKKPMPKHPRRIGIITSASGAAVHDIIRVAKKRYKGVELLIFPSLVQGDKAAAYLAGGIQYFHSVMDNPQQCVDIIIIGRGGGSMEDLWAFNDERLARTVAASQIPVVSAVGHEVDFTICDFVSDLRAATPSAAAELVIPDASAMEAHLHDLSQRLSRPVKHLLSVYAVKLKHLSSAKSLTSPQGVLEQRADALEKTQQRMTHATQVSLERKTHELQRLTAQMEALSPLSVLSRGYAMAQDTDGRVVTSVASVERDDVLKLRFSDGQISALVTEVLVADEKRSV